MIADYTQMDRAIREEKKYIAQVLKVSVIWVLLCCVCCVVAIQLTERQTGLHQLTAGRRVSVMILTIMLLFHVQFTVDQDRQVQRIAGAEVDLA